MQGSLIEPIQRRAHKHRHKKILIQKGNTIVLHLKIAPHGPHMFKDTIKLYTVSINCMQKTSGKTHLKLYDKQELQSAAKVSLIDMRAIDGQLF
jgi:hypothetical protein